MLLSFFISEGLGWIKDEMTPEDYILIHGYHENPEKYQDLEEQKKLLADIAR